MTQRSTVQIKISMQNKDILEETKLKMNLKSLNEALSWLLQNQKKRSPIIKEQKAKQVKAFMEYMDQPLESED
jgi:aryl-alcohol dehydrogenase-like predicted oxidoreductase